MYFVLFISIIAIFLTFLSKYREYDYLFNVAFVLITFIACIHYQFGTDYDNYYDIFRELNSYKIADLTFSEHLFVEIGWAFLNIVFSNLGDPLGFISLVALLNIIQNFIYFIFIKENVPNHLRWLAMIIYLLSANFYILNFSMMRQGLAISLVVLSVMLILKKKKIFSFITIFCASLIHSSALLFLPILISIIIIGNFIRSKFTCVFLWLLVCFSFLASSYMNSIYVFVISISAFEDYQGYDDFGTTTIGIGFFINLIPYIVISFLHFYKVKIIPYNLVVMSFIVFITLILTPVTLKVTLVGRLLYYFSVFSIVVIPNAYSIIRNNLIKNCLFLIYVFMLLVDYFKFFDPSSWSYLGYRDFNTIFEVL